MRELKSILNLYEYPNQRQGKEFSDEFKEQHEQIASENKPESSFHAFIRLLGEQNDQNNFSFDAETYNTRSFWENFLGRRNNNLSKRSYGKTASLIQRRKGKNRLKRQARNACEPVLQSECILTPRTVCQNKLVEKCSEEPEMQCEEVEVCESDNDSLLPKKKITFDVQKENGCKNSTNMVCKTIERDTCTTLTEEACELPESSINTFNGKRKQCKQVPRKICAPVPRKNCVVVPRTKCHSCLRCKEEPDIKCFPRPKRVCTSQPKTKCLNKCADIYVCPLCDGRSDHYNHHW